MNKVIITSYTDPDLDGFACAVAYAELLNKIGTPAGVRFFGNRHVEALYLLEKFDIQVNEDIATNLDKIILVDASELRDLDQFIKPESVVEVIDHRKINDAASFKNAKVQIEFVGAAATLVAERFLQQNIKISLQAATLLYAAIASNTLNFRLPGTTDRDRAMASWLQQTFAPPQNFVDDMFRAKSDVTGDKLEQRIVSDFAWFQLGSQRVGVAQLEVMDVKHLIMHRQKEIFKILENLLRQDTLDRIFISLIDLGEEFNAFCTDDPLIQNILSKILDVTFTNNIAIRKGFIMRKEIVPLLKGHIS